MNLNTTTQTFLDLKLYEPIYKVDSGEVRKVRLKEDWTEPGQFKPTLMKDDEEKRDVIMKKNTGDKEQQQFFIKSNAILKSLNHENVVTVFFDGKIDNYPFFTMEVAEQSLGDLIEKKKIPTDSVKNKPGHYTMSHCISWMMQIANGLAYLHEKRILHRDVKSSNILLFENSKLCKLCDFDFCKKYERDNMTAEVGTLTHMAPELKNLKQTENKKLNYCEKCDCYSYGVTVLEIIFRTSNLGDIPKVTEPPDQQYKNSIFQWHSFYGCVESISLTNSEFDYRAHKDRFKVIGNILQSALQADPDKRQASSLNFSQLKVVQTDKGEIHPLVPQASDDVTANNSQYSNKSTRSNSKKNHYACILYSAFLKDRDQSFNEEIAEQIETVLNAIGQRVNTKAATDKGKPYEGIKHVFRVGPERIIVHTFSGSNLDSVSAIADYCRTDTEMKHTKWLASLFKEDNIIPLRKLQFTVLPTGNEE